LYFGIAINTTFVGSEGGLVDGISLFMNDLVQNLVLMLDESIL